MGGPGSGRQPAWMDGTHCKETTEDYFALDIRAVKRHGLIEEDQEEIPGVARIVWTSSGFGVPEGYYLRPWFICPREECGKRVAILYCPFPEPSEAETEALRKALSEAIGTDVGWSQANAVANCRRALPRRKPGNHSGDQDTPGIDWACRTCRDLCYPVELEDRVGRGIRRMQRMKDKLGPDWQVNRPKGMHRTTFMRLATKYVIASQKAGIAAKERVAHTWDQMEKEDVRWDRELHELRNQGKAQAEARQNAPARPSGSQRRTTTDA